MYKCKIGIVAVIICLIGNLSVAEDQIESTLLYYPMVNSPRANGLGRCSINLVDEQSPLNNPGALGLFHLEKIFAASLPSNTKWLPNFADDIRLKTTGISGGVSYQLFNPVADVGYNFSFGLAYFQKTFELAIPFGERDPGEFNYINRYDRADYYSLGLGFQLERFCRVGIGLTYKQILSELSAPMDFEARSTPFDLGIIVELPLMGVLQPANAKSASRDNGPRFELAASFAFIQSNMGDDIAYDGDDYTDPLPESRRMGISIHSALHRGVATIGSGRLIGEIEEDNKPDNVLKGGLELGLLNIVFLRGGHYDDDQGGVHHTTLGLGLSLNGVIAWLEELDSIQLQDDVMGRLIRNFNVSFDYARFFAEGEEQAVDNTEFFKFNISL